MISMSDLKKNLKIEIDGIPYKVTEYQHVKPGKGPAFVRTKIKSLVDGRVLDRTFKPSDKFEEPVMEQKKMQYLYDDGEMLQFMDNDTYEQIGLNYDQIGDDIKWLIDSMIVEILYHNGKVIGIALPQRVTYKITETPPNFKGDSQGGKKPATLESGAVVQIPFHILTDDSIVVDTESGEYIEKAK